MANLFVVSVFIRIELLMIACIVYEKLIWRSTTTNNSKMHNLSLTVAHV